LKSVSVLLPFHRVDEFFNEAVKSVLNSEDIDVQLILIDDRPASKIEKDLVFADSRILIVQTLGGVGYGKALEIGSREVEFDFVGLMNSDDLVHPSKLKRQLDLLSNSDICITGMQKISENGKSVIPSISGSLSLTQYHPAFLLLGAFGANATWTMHRSWWEEWAIYDSFSALDWRIALNAFPSSIVSVIDEPLYSYRTHNLQSTRGSDAFRDHEVVYREWSSFLSLFSTTTYTESAFHAFAAPWERKEVHDWSELTRWLNEFPMCIDSMSTSQKEEFKRLVCRRTLLLATNFRNWNLKLVPVIAENRRELPSLVIDALTNFRFR
jgi:glycosyltransferase involved in cell wall biosynthesis